MDLSDSEDEFEGFDPVNDELEEFDAENIEVGDDDLQDILGEIQREERDVFFEAYDHEWLRNFDVETGPQMLILSARRSDFLHVKYLKSRSFRGPPAPWTPGQGFALDPPGP